MESTLPTRCLAVAFTALAAALPVPGQAQAPARAERATSAPAPVAEATQFASAADIAALMAKAEAERGKAAIGGGRLLQLAPYNANLEYRTSAGTAAVHETEAELFMVLEGGGTLVTGGKLAGEVKRNGANLSAPASEGGSERHVAKGDVFIVPQNTAHWFKSVDGRLVMISLHVPRPVPGAASAP